MRIAYKIGLNWYQGSIDPVLQPLFQPLLLQLEFLWGHSFLKFIFAPILTLKGREEEIPRPGKEDEKKDKPEFLSQAEARFAALKRAFTTKLLDPISSAPIKSNESIAAALNLRDVSDLYLLLTQTFVCQKHEILNRISYLPSLIPLMWKFMSSLSPKGNMDLFVKAASQPEKEPLISILRLFCEAAYYLLL